MDLFHRWTKSSNAYRTSFKTAEISVQIVRTDSQTTVLVAGRVTIDSSLHMRSMLLNLLQNETGGVVTIDLAKVSYLDTSGIATLLEALKLARERSMKLRLVGASGQVRMLAEVVELAKIFVFFGSEVIFS